MLQEDLEMILIVGETHPEGFIDLPKELSLGGFQSLIPFTVFTLAVETVSIEQVVLPLLIIIIGRYINSSNLLSFFDVPDGLEKEEVANGEP